MSKRANTNSFSVCIAHKAVIRKTEASMNFDLVGWVQSFSAQVGIHLAQKN